MTKPVCTSHQIVERHTQACLDAAVLLITDHPTPALAAELLDRGVQDVLATAVATPANEETAAAAPPAPG